MERFVLEIPEISTDVLFTKEFVSFLLIFLLLAIGVFLCFFGYKYFHTLCVTAVASCFGMMGVHMTSEVTQSAVILLIFFVIFILIGLGVYYAASMAARLILEWLKLYRKVKESEFLAGAIIGAIMIGSTVYFAIYRSLLIAILGVVIFGTLGAVYGKKKSKERIPFYTYEDIYTRKPLNEGEQYD